MKKVKRMAVIMGMILLCAGVLCGCDNGNNSEIGEGTFYTLQEAYNAGYLTKEEIMSIAYYHNGGRVYNEEIMSEDYKPITKTPQELSEKTVNKIKENAAHEYNSEHDPKIKATADGFTIDQYYGTYGNSIVVIITDIYSGSPGIVGIETIANVNLYMNAAYVIKVWKGGAIN